MMLRRLFFVFTIIAVLTILVQGGDSQVGRAASPVIVEGTFNVLWGDGVPGSGETRTSYFLSTIQDDSIQLSLNENSLMSMGGPMGLNQKRVVVQGTWLVAGAFLQVQSITLDHGLSAIPQAVIGHQPWVSIMCKFADVAAEPRNLAYFQGMYSANYPGLDHFWRQNSYELVDLVGSGAYGWFTLPHVRTYYLPNGNLDWWTAAADCTAAANSSVDFTPYVGLNLMFNADLDCCAWGGTWYACLDGICKNWRTTWEPPWGYESTGVIAHETGHGFGLPHSSGDYGAVYDNQWDVMSDFWSNFYRGGYDLTYGTLGQHTISYHKDILGWIDPAQMLIAEVGTISTITLERIALPQTTNFLGARVLIDDSPNHFFTVEARKFAGYDTWLPGEAVIIHEVVLGRGEPAHVVDIDGNGNTGDEGAMWRSGETFISSANGIAVKVDSVTPTGFIVTIRNRFTQMTAVEITGAEQGNIIDSIPFTATVSPSDATIPITYTWEATGLPSVIQVGDTVDQVEFTWDEIGTKAITVTASNAGGMVVDTHLITIANTMPIVTLSGPSESSVGDVNVFTATVSPVDVPQPITYTWQASGQLPIIHTTGLIDTVDYVWDDPGTQVITVTATNIHGSTVDTISLPVRMPPDNVRVSGPETGEVQSSYTFTALINPITTTIPITYVWTIDGHSVITHTAGVSDTLYYNWDYPGPHQLAVSASNPAGSVVDSWSITIYVKVFVPISLRN